MREIETWSERAERDTGVGVFDTSSLHIRLLQLMHKWVWMTSTHCDLMGAYVCAWERRFCQPAFVCISAHVSLFKHRMLVIWCQRTYAPNKTLSQSKCTVTSIGPTSTHQPLRPHPIAPLFFLLSPCSFCEYGATAVKGPPGLAPTGLSGYRETLFTANTYSMLCGQHIHRGCHSVSMDYEDFLSDIWLPSTHRLTCTLSHFTGSFPLHHSLSLGPLKCIPCPVSFCQGTFLGRVFCFFSQPRPFPLISALACSHGQRREEA